MWMLLHLGFIFPFCVAFFSSHFSPCQSFPPSLFLWVWLLSMDRSIIYVFIGNAGCLPQLVSDQVLKLKQLTVLTLAERSKVFLPTLWFLFALNMFIYLLVWGKVVTTLSSNFYVWCRIDIWSLSFSKLNDLGFLFLK